MSKHQQAQEIVKSHVLWSIGGGLIPLPIADVAAVTALQIGMIDQLAKLYGVETTQSSGKTFVTALTGGSAAKLGASLLKLIPGIGTAVGIVAMSAASGVSTYAIGQVVIQQFEGGGTLLDMNMEKAKEAYEKAKRQGKEFVENLQKEQEDAPETKTNGHAEPKAKTATNETAGVEDIVESLEKLGELRDKGVITAEEFENTKKRLLTRL